MRQSMLTLAALAGLTFAQNQTIPIWFPETDGDVPIVASVLSANPTATTVVAGCAPGVDGSDCGLGPGVTFAVVSKTRYEATLVESDALQYTVVCNYNSAKPELACAETAAGTAANFPGTTTTTYSGSELGTPLTVTITAGGEKLSAATAAATTTGTAKPSAAQAVSGASVKGSSAPQHTGAASRFGVGAGMLAVGGAAVLGAL